MAKKYDETKEVVEGINRKADTYVEKLMRGVNLGKVTEDVKLLIKSGYMAGFLEGMEKKE